MRTKALVAVSLVSLAALAAAGAASAGGGHGGHSRQQLRHELRQQVRRDVRRQLRQARRDARQVRRELRQARRHVRAHARQLRVQVRQAPRPAGVHYSFLGRLTAVPESGGVSVTVEGGNRRALRAMLGQPVTQTFAYGDSTEFLRWSRGVPTVVRAGDLAAGDYVRVNVRAPRGASLADLVRVESPLVGDHGTQLYPPTQPLYVFRGTIAAAGSSSVSVDVRGGNRRALRLLVGQSPGRTLAIGSDTIVLLWHGRVPTVIEASQLKTGDRVVVRVRAPKGSTLAQVESTPARHVADHERG